MLFKERMCLLSFLMTKDKCPLGMALGLESRNLPIPEHDGLFAPFLLFSVFSCIFVLQSLSRENKMILEMRFKQNKAIVGGQA